MSSIAIDDTMEIMENQFRDIRYDLETKKGSVLDVIMVVTGKTSGNASNTVKALPEELTQEISQLRINGKGRETPVADAKTLVQIVWELPGKAAKEFRRGCANYICRILGGDPTLVREMEMRVRHTPDEQKSLFLKGVDIPMMDLMEESEQRLIAKRKIETVLREDEARVAKLEFENKRMDAETKKFEWEFTQSVVQCLKTQTNGDERMKILANDLFHRQSMQLFGGSPLLLDNGDDEQQGQKSKRQNRKYEIGIPLVAQKHNLKYSPSNSSGIGKMVKKLYIQRHGTPPPKRQVLFRGKPIAENAYWSDDEDIMVAAITFYASNSTEEQAQSANELIERLNV